MSDNINREDERETEGHGLSTGPKGHEFGAKPDEEQSGEVEGHGLRPGQGIWATEDPAESRSE